MKKNYSSSSSNPEKRLFGSVVVLSKWTADWVRWGAAKLVVAGGGHVERETAATVENVGVHSFAVLYRTYPSGQGLLDCSIREYISTCRAIRRIHGLVFVSAHNN